MELAFIIIIVGMCFIYRYIINNSLLSRLMDVLMLIGGGIYAYDEYDRQKTNRRTKR